MACSNTQLSMRLSTIMANEQAAPVGHDMHVAVGAPAAALWPARDLDDAHGVSPMAVACAERADARANAACFAYVNRLLGEILRLQARDAGRWLRVCTARGQSASLPGHALDARPADVDELVPLMAAQGATHAARAVHEDSALEAPERGLVHPRLVRARARLLVRRMRRDLRRGRRLRARAVLAFAVPLESPAAVKGNIVAIVAPLRARGAEAALLGQRAGEAVEPGVGDRTEARTRPRARPRPDSGTRSARG
jgi:hypothetical protein